jgi:hypothetical protein
LQDQGLLKNLNNLTQLISEANLGIIIKTSQLLSEAELRKNYQNNLITFRSQVRHGIKTTQLLSEAKLGMESKQLNYFLKKT